jgi:hypothetical protein
MCLGNELVCEAAVLRGHDEIAADRRNAGDPVDRVDDEYLRPQRRGLA